ncbi:hypothetical protein HOY80DRAFT_44316 [Tuber brumale]|nr:hypothetical protein HOY80DRAFT_44316 [Tuber brumale]
MSSQSTKQASKAAKFQISQNEIKHADVFQVKLYSNAMQAMKANRTAGLRFVPSRLKGWSRVGYGTKWRGTYSAPKHAKNLFTTENSHQSEVITFIARDRRSLTPTSTCRGGGEGRAIKILLPLRTDGFDQFPSPWSADHLPNRTEVVAVLEIRPRIACTSTVQVLEYVRVQYPTIPWREGGRERGMEETSWAGKKKRNGF